MRTRIIIIVGILATIFLQPALVLSQGSSTRDSNSRDCWSQQTSNSTASLRGICAVSDSVCWASGSQGTVLLTVNGGETWTAVGPGNSAEMDFRDVHAWDDSTAVIMAAGDPDQVFRTEDGGKTWTSVFEHSDKNAFLDGIAFDKDGVNGWMMGDPLDGHLTLAKTCLLYTSPSPRDLSTSRMPSSA